MGRIPLSQLEKVQELPYQIGSRKICKVNHEYRYRHHREKHPINGVEMYDLIDRVIKTNIGKRFDHAFHKFCKIVPVYQQKYFIKEFEPKKRVYNWTYHVIDNDTNIQVVNTKEKAKKPIRFTSFDYLSEYRHIHTGKPKPKYDWRNKVKEEMYESVIIRGFEEYFDDKKDRKLRRLNAEKMKLRKKHIKSMKMANRNSIDEQKFRSILNEKKLKEQANNLVKIISHGFDPITSFRK